MPFIDEYLTEFYMAMFADFINTREIDDFVTQHTCAQRHIYTLQDFANNFDEVVRLSRMPVYDTHDFVTGRQRFETYMGASPSARTRVTRAECERRMCALRNAVNELTEPAVQAELEHILVVDHGEYIVHDVLQFLRVYAMDLTEITQDVSSRENGGLSTRRSPSLMDDPPRPRKRGPGPENEHPDEPAPAAGAAEPAYQPLPRGVKRARTTKPLSIAEFAAKARAVRGMRARAGVADIALMRGLLVEMGGLSAQALFE
jgi:hypothetical protein